MKHGKPFHSTAYLREACGDNYFQWLADDVALHGDCEYWRLLRALHRKEFYYALKSDSIMWDDGLYLRYMYKRNYRDYEDNNPILPTCLEALIGLAMRLEVSLTDYSMYNWFWLFLENLGLDRFDDDQYDEMGGTDMVNYILSVWLSRQYKHDGTNYNIFYCDPKIERVYNMKEVDMLHQGYNYIRSHFGPGKIYDIRNYQTY